MVSNRRPTLATVTVVTCWFIALPTRANPFDGCKVLAAGNPRSIIACGLDRLIIMDTAGPDTNAVQGMLFGISHQAAPPLERSDAPVQLNGTPHKAVSIVDSKGVRYVVTLDAHPEGMRAFLCSERDSVTLKCPSRLDAAQKWAWATGPPASIPREALKPMFAGRPLKVPEGCEFSSNGDAGGGMKCSDRTILTWVELSTGATWNAEEWASRVPIRGNRTVAACAVAGITTKCWTTSAPAEDAELHISDAVEVRGTRVAVMCLHKGIGSPLPAACSSVLSVKTGP